MRKPKQKYPVDEIVQRRLNSLEWLIDREYDQSPKTFQDRTGITMTQVNQWFSGYRALRDKALKRLEEKTRRKPGWFDAVHAAASIKGPMLQATGAEDSGKPAATELPRHQEVNGAPGPTKYTIHLEHGVAAECAMAIDHLSAEGRERVRKFIQEVAHPKAQSPDPEAVHARVPLPTAGRKPGSRR